MKKKKPRSIGNPTRARKAAFLRAFDDNGSVTRSALLAGIDRTTHYQWLSEDARYKAEFDLMIEMAKGDALDDLVRRGRVGEFQPFIYKGQFQYAVIKRTLCSLADGTTAFQDELPEGATILERRTVTTRGEMLGVYKPDPKALWKAFQTYKALQAVKALPPKEADRWDTADDDRLALVARFGKVLEEARRKGNKSTEPEDSDHPLLSRHGRKTSKTAGR